MNPAKALLPLSSPLIRYPVGAASTICCGAAPQDLAAISVPQARPEFFLLDRPPGADPRPLYASTLERDSDDLGQRAFKAHWQRYQAEGTRPRHFLRASAENLFLLGIGSALYWHNAYAKDRDNDLPPRLSSLGKKLLGEAIRFDHNRFYTNAFEHPMAGAGYYVATRSNGYGPFGSFLFSLAASSVWEYLGEYVEFVSINDQVFTPVGGAVIGEVFYQLSEFFAASADTPINSVLKWVFNPFSNVHRWLDDAPAIRAAEMDRFDFRQDIWHRFTLFTGVGMAGDTPIGEFHAETQLIHLPGYGARRGDVSAWLNGVLFTQMQFRSSFAESGVQDLSLFFKAMFLGYFRQRLGGPEEGTWRGFSVVIGPASAYELNTHEWSTTGIQDTYGVVHLLGPSIHFALYQGAVRLRMNMAAYGDFAAIRSFAVDAFKQRGSVEGAKSVLGLQDYYFGLGLTVRAQGALAYDRLAMGMHGRYSYYDSVEGLDIDEEEITNEVKTQDTIAAVGTWIRYEVISDLMNLAFSYERRWRAGMATDGNVRVKASETENRFIGSLLLLF